MYKFFILSTALFISFLVFVSCSLESTAVNVQSEVADGVIVTPFERVDLGNNEYIEYYESDPGDFMMMCVFNSVDRISSIKNKNPLECYEYFLKKTPSTKLIEAYRRSNPVAQDGENADEESTLISPETDPQTTRMSAEAFKEAYYDPSYGFWLISKLWTNVTGTGSYSRDCSEMISWAHPYRGTITHRVRWNNFWGTRKSSSNTLTQGQVGYAYSRASFQRWREITIYNADGDGYHASIFATQ